MAQNPETSDGNLQFLTSVNGQSPACLDVLD